MSQSDNVRAFREALGAFATGVTIVTTRDADGNPVGVTASSFNSVSLEPPMILWSLAKTARSLAAFQSNGHFAVHVLAAGQEALASRFAQTGEDKFDGLDWKAGTGGAPLFDEFEARFECELRHQYDGGDHIILVGEVSAYETQDRDGLMFYRGAYAECRPIKRDSGGADPLPLADSAQSDR